MEAVTEIRWHGRGGQGVVTGSEILAEAALLEGKYFQALPEFGAERSGAPIRAYTRISPQPIHIHFAIAQPDALVILDPTLLGNPELLQGLKPGGVVVLNTPRSPQEIKEKMGLEAARVVTIDASRIALGTIGRNTPNVPILSALLRALPLVSMESLLQAIRSRLGSRLSARVVEANCQAVDQASREIREG